jgi:hypothetical protein
MPWQFSRIESVRDFRLMLEGVLWRHQRYEDLAGMIMTDVLIAGGVKYSHPGAPPVPPDLTRPTFEKVMGRLPVPFFDPIPTTPEEEAAEQERQAALEAKAARIQAMHFEAIMRRDHPEMLVGDEEPEQSPPE